MKINKYILSIAIISSLTIFTLKDGTLGVSGIQKEYKNTTESSTIDTLLVNNDNKLGSEYSPKEFKVPQIPFINGATNEEMQMDEVAIDAIEELFKVAKSEGINLLATSAYRSYNTQKNIYNKRVKSQGVKKADEYVARPGTSEHQTGLAIDITNEERWFVEVTKEAMWLAENAYRFGFILRYEKGKEAITGKSYEPWHVRYVGKEIAKDIFEQGITLEEYIENK